MWGQGPLGTEVTFFRHLLGSRSPSCLFTYVCFLFIFTFALYHPILRIRKLKLWANGLGQGYQLLVAGFGDKPRWEGECDGEVGIPSQDRIASRPVAFQRSAVEEILLPIYNVSLTLPPRTRTGHWQSDPWPALHSPLKGTFVC